MDSVCEADVLPRMDCMTEGLDGAKVLLCHTNTSYPCDCRMVVIKLGASVYWIFKIPV